MATQLTADDAKQSLTSHLASKGTEIHQKYGPRLGWAELQQLLNDRAYVRYPCEIKFDAAELLPGEFACPIPKGEVPEEGFVMYVHPIYMLDLSQVPLLVLYQLVALNYGAFASADDAEIFGANAAGMSRDEYYAAICALADQLGGGDAESELATPPIPFADGGCGNSGCGCP